MTKTYADLISNTSGGVGYRRESLANPYPRSGERQQFLIQLDAMVQEAIEACTPIAKANQPTDARMAAPDYEDGKLYVYDGETQTFMKPEPPRNAEGWSIGAEHPREDLAYAMIEMICSRYTGLSTSTVMGHDLGSLMALIAQYDGVAKADTPIAKASVPNDARMDASLADQVLKIVFMKGQASEVALHGIIAEWCKQKQIYRPEVIMHQLVEEVRRLAGEVPAKPFDVAFGELRLTQEERVSLAHHLGSLRYRKTVEAIVPGAAQRMAESISNKVKDTVGDGIKQHLGQGSYRTRES